SHAGFNIREGAVDGLTVHALARAWSAGAPGAVGSSPAVVAGSVFVVSTGGLSAFPAGGCATDPCRAACTARATGRLFGPAIGGRTVFVTAGDGRLLAYPAAGCGSAACEPAWTATIGPGS